MPQKETLMFTHKYMGVGGIQTYLYRLITKLKKEGYRIIWIYPQGTYIDDEFFGEFFDGSIEIIKVDFDKPNWIKNCEINFDKDEVVVALAFNLFNFIFLEKIKKKYSLIQIHDFFWVPHFKEKEVFIEEFASRSIRPLFKQIIRKIIINMELNDNIIYVNKSHLDALTQNYSYNVNNDFNKKLLSGNSRDIPEYDINLNEIRSERTNFNIITVSRLSFPHKAYILGLVRAYASLKPKYNQLKLTIIGYGPDEEKVIEEISKLQLDLQKDIYFIGKVPYPELTNYFNRAHLNIGVAGTIADAALTGLVSIPVRHYSEKCEGYGYLPESKNYTTSSEPGIPIEGFIEEVINMSKSEYLNLSKKSYDTYTENKENSFYQLMHMRNKNYKKILRPVSIVQISASYKIAKWIRDTKGAIKKFLNEGLQ